MRLLNSIGWFVGHEQNGQVIVQQPTAEEPSEQPDVGRRSNPLPGGGMLIHTSAQPQPIKDNTSDDNGRLVTTDNSHLPPPSNGDAILITASSSASDMLDLAELNQLIRNCGKEEETDTTIDQETGLKIIDLEEVGNHDTDSDAWTVIYDKVYNVTEYLQHHPGGYDVMKEYVGFDATIAYRGVGHSKAAMRKMSEFLIGILPKQQRLGFTPF